jgi:hypothetical protein
MQNFYHNIGFLRKTPIFSPKIVENRDHNIDPQALDVDPKMYYQKNFIDESDICSGLLGPQAHA